MKVPKEVAKTQRGGAVRKETHKARLDELFKGKKFMLVQEILMPKGMTFKTCTGNPARAGYMLRDINSGEVFLVGKYTFRRIRVEYDIIYRPKKKGRPLGAKNKKTVEREKDSYLSKIKYTDGLIDRN